MIPEFEVARWTKLDGVWRASVIRLIPCEVTSRVFVIYALTARALLRLPTQNRSRIHVDRLAPSHFGSFKQTKAYARNGADAANATAGKGPVVGREEADGYMDRTLSKRFQCCIRDTCVYIAGAFRTLPRHCAGVYTNADMREVPWHGSRA